MPRGNLRLCASLALLFAHGCVSDDPIITPIANERVIRGRFIVVHAERDAAFCDRSTEEADDYIEQTSRFLGIEPRPIDYYLYGSTRFNCTVASRPGDIPPGVAAACALRSQRAVMTRQWFHQHEVAHVIAQGWGTDAPSIFEEGLATMLAYPRNVDEWSFVDRAARIEDNLDSWTFAAVAADERLRLYEASAEFLRFVLDRFGVATLRRWYESVDNLSSADHTREQFARATGISLDEALRQWRASPRVNSNQKHLRLVECAQPRVLTAFEDASLDGVAECRTYGLARTPTQRQQTTEIPRDDWYDVEMSSEATLVGSMDRCDAATDPWTVRSNGGATRSLLWMERGRAVFSIAPATMDARVRWSVRAATIPTDRCPTRTPIRAERSGSTAVFSAPIERWPYTRADRGDARAMSLHVFGGSSGLLRVSLVDRPAGAEITLCTEPCNGFEACAPLTPDAPHVIATNALFGTPIELRTTASSGVVTVLFQP